MLKRNVLLGCLAVGALASPLLADEVIFNNGDHLTGKVLSVGGGKLKIKTTVAGEVIVDLNDVKTFTSDEELQIRFKDNKIVRDKIGAVPATATAPVVVAPSTQPGSVEVAG